MTKSTAILKTASTRTRRAGMFFALLCTSLATLPVSATAERSPLAKAAFACADNDTLDQGKLQKRMTDLGWRKVSSVQGFQSLSMFGGFMGLAHHAGSPDWVTSKATVGTFQELLKNDPQHAVSELDGKTEFFTHPKYRATLLRTFTERDRQYCQFALTSAAWNDETLYQFRILAEVADKPGFEFASFTTKDDIELMTFDMVTNVSSRIVENNKSRPGPSKGRVRFRQIGPANKSREPFQNIFKARGWLSVLYQPDN
ncbi:MAG: hypothetical protein ACSHXB_16845 [Sulfitobacter sp.]